MFSENLHQLLDVGNTISVYQHIIRHPKWLIGPKLMVEGMPDIYLVSDHIAERLDELRELYPQIFHLVKKQFWSCELGMIKQDPDFFPAVLEMTKLKPDEAIFIDDSIENVISAGKAGIDGICFHGADQLMKSLSRRGVGFSAPFAP
jgi:FMN phosphatase YigB (HAD superfamily)